MMYLSKTVLDEMGMKIAETGLNDEDLVTKKMWIVGHEDEDVLYCIYEDVEEQLKTEKEMLSKLDKITIKLEKDEAYKDLKNATQRELYLLQKHDIPSSQAKKVIELLNVRKILK